MKLKYYLRGLGIGIAVTALIMGSAGSQKPTEMTDAQIMERAKELGMVDGVLSQLETPETEASKESETPKKTEISKQPETAKPEAETESKPESPQKPETEKQEDKKPEQEVVKKIIVTVYPGEGSYTVSRKLAALGLVESADIYDKFLCQNGYDKKITTGNHEVEEGMTAEQIAKALTLR